MPGQQQQPGLEATLRGMNWKTRVRVLKAAVEQHHRAIELPVMMRRWLDLNRGEIRTVQDAEHTQREIVAITEMGVDAGWGDTNTETLPILGWVVSAAHFLRDGTRWWLFTAQRHDDAAPVLGPIVPAPARPADLRKLAKIITYAGGNPKRELLRTGAITQGDRDGFIADGSHDIAEYGLIFYWWQD